MESTCTRNTWNRSADPTPANTLLSNPSKSFKKLTCSTHASTQMSTQWARIAKSLLLTSGGIITYRRSASWAGLNSLSCRISWRILNLWISVMSQSVPKKVGNKCVNPGKPWTKATSNQTRQAAWTSSTALPPSSKNRSKANRTNTTDCSSFRSLSTQSRTP